MVFSDCGQRLGTPGGVRLQSRARIRAPISPPPARKPSSDEVRGSPATPMLIESRIKLLLSINYEIYCVLFLISIEWYRHAKYGPSRGGRHDGCLPVQLLHSMKYRRHGIR